MPSCSACQAHMPGSVGHNTPRMNSFDGLIPGTSTVVGTPTSKSVHVHASSQILLSLIQGTSITVPTLRLSSPLFQCAVAPLLPSNITLHKKCALKPSPDSSPAPVPPMQPEHPRPPAWHTRSQWLAHGPHATRPHLRIAPQPACNSASQPEQPIRRVRQWATSRAGNEWGELGGLWG